MRASSSSSPATIICTMGPNTRRRMDSATGLGTLHLLRDSDKYYIIKLCLGKITGCSTRMGRRSGLPRVRVRVGKFPPVQNPRPQQGFGGQARFFFCLPVRSLIFFFV
jgi:hypothetical protein